MRDQSSADGRTTPGSTSSAAERRQVAWIGRGVRIEGTVTSAEDLVIDGEVEGLIQLSDHSLSIGPTGSVKADLSARRISISGRVTGNIKASERVDLHATGSVTGNIVAPRFVMADGSTVAGKVDAG